MKLVWRWSLNLLVHNDDVQQNNGPPNKPIIGLIRYVSEVPQHCTFQRLTHCDRAFHIPGTYRSANYSVGSAAPLLCTGSSEETLPRISPRARTSGVTMMAEVPVRGLHTTACISFLALALHRGMMLKHRPNGLPAIVCYGCGFLLRESPNIH